MKTQTFKTLHAGVVVAALTAVASSAKPADAPVVLAATGNRLGVR